jgi:FkbM family methyltransferase
MKLIKLLTPPIFINSLKKLRKCISSHKNTNQKLGKDKSTFLENVVIEQGTLKGYKLLVTKPLNSEQEQMVLGQYDTFFETAVNWRTVKKVFDIGCHVGYSTILFDKLMSCNESKIISIDANKLVLKRAEQNLEANRSSLFSDIILNNYAVSDSIGTLDFYFSDNVDNPESTGGFLQGSETPFDLSLYTNLGFNKASIPTLTVDNLSKTYGNPDVIKIDVEGAEALVLKGAMGTIKTTKSMVILVEIHSLKAMFDVYDVLASIGRQYIVTSLDCDNWSKSRGFVKIVFDDFVTD